METMRWGIEDSVFVIVHTAQAPTDKEWDAVIAEYAAHLGKFHSILVVTHGGAPSASQRNRVNSFWKGKDMPKTAVMTSSALVRGAITAINWLAREPLRPFKSSDWDGVFEYFHLGFREKALAKEAVRRHSAKLGLPIGELN